MRLKLVIAALMVSGACSSSDPGAIEMSSGHRFTPLKTTVIAGDEVTWTNTTGEPHSVTLYQDSLPEGADYFSSGGAPSEKEARASVEDELVTDGESFSVVLNTPGEYRYFCIPHESHGMVGTIEVKPQG